MTHRRILWSAVASVALALSACSSDEDSSPSGAEPNVSAPASTDVEIKIADEKFVPDEVTVAVGTTVTWTNEDEGGHTVTHGEGGSAETEALFDEAVSAGQAVTYTFEEPGTYPVTCRIHHAMQMTVIVEESGS